MTGVELVAAVNAAAALLSGLVQAAETAFNEGKMTDDEIRQVRIRAAHAQEAWDRHREEVRARLAAKSAGQ
jgi:hypothetical protein